MRSICSGHAFWHGVRPGYYLCFAFVFAMVAVEQLARSSLLAAATKLRVKTTFTVATDTLLNGRRPQVNYDSTRTDLKPGQLQGLDRRRGEKLRKGKLEIEGTLDLHGMTRSQAQGAVRRFIDASQSMGRRTVLVITGKGYSHGGDGVLRSELPRWLNSDPLRAKIVAYDFAQPRHGGQGAYYVYIKKVRDTS